MGLATAGRRTPDAGSAQRPRSQSTGSSVERHNEQQITSPDVLLLDGSALLVARSRGHRPKLAVVQFLSEHHDDAAWAADISELVDVLVGGHAAQRVAAVPGGDL